MRPLVILAVPSQARTASAAVAGTGAPIIVAIWGKPSLHAPLAIVGGLSDDLPLM
jgi:hypothetical protein